MPFARGEILIRPPACTLPVAAAATGAASACAGASCAAGGRLSAVNRCRSRELETFSPGSPITLRSRGTEHRRPLPPKSRAACPQPSLPPRRTLCPSHTRKRTSPSATLSPTCLFHFVMIQLSTDCPCLGIITAVAIEFTSVMVNLLNAPKMSTSHVKKSSNQQIRTHSC